MEIESRTQHASEFSSFDLYLCAFLIARGLQLLRTERNQGRVRWIFVGGTTAARLHHEFLNNGPVPVGDYRRCLQDLKTEIFAAT